MVDNVEKVEVDNAIGTYTIQVSHKGNLLNGSQNYSLIVSGFDVANLSNVSFEDQVISVYPNPIKDVVYVNSSTHQFSSYELFDIQGRLIRKENLSNLNNFQINTSSFSKGIYLLNLVSAEGVFVKKIIKD